MHVKYRPPNVSIALVKQNPQQTEYYGAEFNDSCYQNSSSRTVLPVLGSVRFQSLTRDRPHCSQTALYNIQTIDKGLVSAASLLVVSVRC